MEKKAHKASGRWEEQDSWKIDEKQGGGEGGRWVVSGLQVAEEAHHAAHALQQAVQAAPGGGQALLRALRTLRQLGVGGNHVAVHVQGHLEQGLGGCGGGAWKKSEAGWRASKGGATLCPATEGAAAQ